MRKLILMPALFCLLMLNVKCSSSDDNPSSNPTPVINAATSGTWKITSFVDSGNDETNHFTGYNFTFASSNVLTATNGTNTYTGVWSVISDDNSSDDNPSTDLDFNIAFTSPADFTDLTEDWNIVSYSSTTIALVHISGGNGGTDTLVFTKN